MGSVKQTVAFQPTSIWNVCVKLSFTMFITGLYNGR